MFDFLKTASGGLNMGLIATILGWSVATFGMVVSIYKHRSVVFSAQAAAELSEKQNKEQERLRIEADRLRHAAENRLAQAEAEIEQLKPKPLPDRLRSFLDRVHTGWEDELRGGTTEFAGQLPTHLLTELQNLAAEDGSAGYITIVRQQPVGTGPDGFINKVSIVLTTDLLPTKK